MGIVRRLALCLVVLGSLGGCKITPDEQPVAEPPARATPPAEPAAEPQPADPEPAAEPATPTGALPAVPTLADPPAPVGAPAGPAIVAATTVGEPAAESTTAIHAAHRDALRGWLLRTRRAAVLISQPAGYAWLTGGHSNQIAADAPPAVIAVLAGRTLVLAPSDIQAAARAPLAALGIAGGTYRWDLGRDPAAPVRAVAAQAGGGVIAADEHRPGTEYVADELAELRLTTSAAERRRLAWLGQTLAKVTAEQLETVTAEMTEAALAAAIDGALRAVELTPVDLRVTSLARLAEAGLGPGGAATLADGAAVSVTAARWGLHATCGRTVAPAPSPDAADAYGQARAIYGALLGKLRVGVAPRDVFRAGVAAADGLGLPLLFGKVSPGGLGAYQPAERAIGPSEVRPLAAGNVVTLTVRLPRAYLAETLVVGADAVEILTHAGAWPSPKMLVAGRLVPVPTLRGAEQAVADAETARLAETRRVRAFGFLEKVVGGALSSTLAAKPVAPVEGPPAPAAAGEAPAEP